MGTHSTPDLLEGAINSVGDLFYVFTPDGGFLEWNAQFRNVTGYTDEEISNLRPAAIVPDAERAAVNEALETVTEDSEIVTFPTIIETKTGNRIPYEFQWTPFGKTERNGSAVASIGRKITDISDHTKREEELVQYEAAFKKAGDGMTITDDEARILDVNEAAAHIYGENRADLIGRSMQEFLPDEFDFEAEWGEIQAAKMVRNELEIVSADGGTNAIEYTAKTDIVPGQHLIVSRDITDRKEYERRISALKERYQTLLEEIPAPVVVSNGETGEIIETNSAIETLLDRSRAQLLGEELHTIFPQGDVDLYHEVFGPPHGPTETITSLPDGSTPKLVTAAGGSVPVEASIGTVALSDRDVMVAIFRDVSDREAGTKSLQQRNKQLETFASEVSHDLRNPLNVANGRLELLKEECDSEHLNTIESAHERMERLIADLLVLARDGDVSDREVVDLSELATCCWGNVATESATLVVDADRTIRADVSRFEQLFENLFRNAVEHGGNEVTVIVGDLANGFYVTDDGPGIPEAKRKAVFEEGYSTSEDGSGFGLSIVEEIVTAHDWDIQVTEGMKGGARFEITGMEFAAE